MMVAWSERETPVNVAQDTRAHRHHQPINNRGRLRTEEKKKTARRVYAFPELTGRARDLGGTERRVDL